MKNKSLQTLSISGVLVTVLSACGGGSDDGDSGAAIYAVSTSAGAGGNIGPESMMVDSGDTASFAINADDGFAIESVSGCNGTLSGSTYTTGNITANCTVTASFSDILFTVTANAGAGGSITPGSIDVDLDDVASFTITPDAGFVIGTVSGCNGTLLGSTYTTDAITADCSVSASFTDASVSSYTVNASATQGGSISPSFELVAEGNTASFTIVADNGYTISSVTGCNGSLSGDTYTTQSITNTCDVVATFSELAAPTANAGADQAVEELTNVVLLGSASDTDGTIVSYHWEQTSGPAVTLSSADTASANFDAPDVVSAEILVFELTVTDNDGLSNTDAVEVTVQNIIDSPITVLAATGLPAVDFPDGFIYWSVSQPSIGDSGHVAFLGFADVAIGQTDQNTAALWAGMPDNLRVVMRENDTLPGLPSNVLYGGHSSASSELPPIVTNDGFVAHSVYLKGAVTDNNNTALIAHANNMLYTVIREGDQAPGFPDGYVIYQNFGSYAFSNAGMVFTAQARDPSTGNFGVGIWFWDFNELTLIAATNLLGDDLSIPSETPGIFADDCKFNFSALTVPQINNNGEILFVANLHNGNGSDCPDADTILKWREGTYTALLSNGDPVPGLDGYGFNLQNLFGFMRNIHLAENGNVSFHSYISTTGDIRSINWAINADDSQEYLSIGEEILPGSANIAMHKNLPTLAAPISDAEGNYLIGTVENANSQETWLLKGVSRPLPYSTISELGASQLTKLVKRGDVPPDYPSTAFFSTINLLDFPSMNASGEVIFSASRADALSPNVETRGIWHIDPSGEITLLLELGDTVSVDASETQVNGFLFTTNIARTGGYSRHSDTGQFIIPGGLANAYQAILLITP